MDGRDSRPENSREQHDQDRGQNCGFREILQLAFAQHQKERGDQGSNKEWIFSAKKLTETSSRRSTAGFH